MSTDVDSFPPLVVLDRDGVINEDSDAYIKSVEEWIPLPGSLEAISRLNHAGILVAVASNQSGIARGMFSRVELNRMHAKFQRELARVGGHVDGIFFCPHGPDDGCNCRKPAPGLLQAIGERFNLSLDRVPFIGDTHGDMMAAHAAGAKPVLVRTGKGLRTLGSHPDLNTLAVYDDLSCAVDALMNGDPHT